MKDCEHLLEEIADRQKQILDILVFFKILVIVILSFVGVGYLLSWGFWIFVITSLSSVVR